MLLYFGNKTDVPLRNLNTEFARNDAVQVFCKPDKLDPTLLPG